MHIIPKILKDPSSAIKIVENGLKAIGVIAGAEIVNHVSESHKMALLHPFCIF
jgi:hypothetical protein